MIFWGILLLQSLTIFTVDKIWVKNIPQTTNLWNRILHSIQKSSYPFPYTNWHEENGTCLQHLKRKKLVHQEVLVTIIVNLVFNMILLFPLPIFCKTISLIFCFHTNHSWLTKKIFFEDLGVLERQNQVETDIGALDMENEAFKKAQLFSWIFFPIWIILAIIQAVCFLLSTGKLHPLAKILEACNDGNDKKIVTRYLLLRFLTLISI